MGQAREIGIQLTLQEKRISYKSEWKGRSLEYRKEVKLTSSFDMGWQKRNSGHTYDSLSGHDFVIGCNSKKIIGSVLSSKRCLLCSKFDNQDDDPPIHV